MRSFGFGARSNVKMLLAQNICRNYVVHSTRLSSRLDDVRKRSECQSVTSNEDDERRHGTSLFHKHCWQSRHYSTTTQKDLRSYYEVLGVTPSCSKEKIKSAFYRLSKVYHPDVNKSEAAHMKFQEIVEAYEILSNTKTREQYDNVQKQSQSHYREVKFGQSRYNNSGMPPQGRAMYYNYDKWYKEHYSEAFKRTKQVKEKTKAEEEFIRKQEEKKDMPSPFDARDIPLYIAAASICLLIYQFLKK